MTKKRIADLLKEEVEKPADTTSSAKDPLAGQSEDKSASQPAAKPASKTSGRTRKRSSAKTTTAKTSTAKTTTAKATTAKSAASKAKSAEPDGHQSDSKQAVAEVALAKKITDLERQLAESTDQIAALQEDVDTHQGRIFELKDALEKAEKKSISEAEAAQSAAEEKDAQIKTLTAELEEAKQTILKLSASRPDSRKPLVSKREKSEKKAIAQPSAAKKTTTSGLSVRKPYSSYKSIPEYAIKRGTALPGQNNSMLDDDDIGWVD